MFGNNNDKENWLKAEATTSDKSLANLISGGWKNDKIINEFAKDKEKPKFNKMLFVNEELCKMIVSEWEVQEKIQESDEANYKSSHKSF